jgi:hypothetical protein
MHSYALLLFTMQRGAKAIRGSWMTIRAGSIRTFIRWILYGENYFNVNQGLVEHYFSLIHECFSLVRLPPQSLILSGTSGWTLYDHENSKGRSICIFPTITTNYKPTFVPDLQSVLPAYFVPLSMRLGCHTPQQAHYPTDKYLTTNNLMQPPAWCSQVQIKRSPLVTLKPVLKNMVDCPFFFFWGATNQRWVNFLLG